MQVTFVTHWHWILYQVQGNHFVGKVWEGREMFGNDRQQLISEKTGGWALYRVHNFFIMCFLQFTARKHSTMMLMWCSAIYVFTQCRPLNRLFTLWLLTLTFWPNINWWTRTCDVLFLCQVSWFYFQPFGFCYADKQTHTDAAKRFTPTTVVSTNNNEVANLWCFEKVKQSPLWQYPKISEGKLWWTQCNITKAERERERELSRYFGSGSHFHCVWLCTWISLYDSDQ